MRSKFHGKSFLLMSLFPKIVHPLRFFEQKTKKWIKYNPNLVFSGCSELSYRPGSSSSFHTICGFLMIFLNLNAPTMMMRNPYFFPCLTMSSIVLILAACSASSFSSRLMLLRVVLHQFL